VNHGDRLDPSTGKCVRVESRTTRRSVTEKTLIASPLNGLTTIMLQPEGSLWAQNKIWRKNGWV
jgi:hypothetical protein